MALNKRAFVQLTSVPWASDQPSLTISSYATPDPVASVMAAGYFNGLRDDGRIKVNDFVECYCVMGTATVADMVRLRFATVPATGNVTVLANSSAAGA